MKKQLLLTTLALATVVATGSISYGLGIENGTEKGFANGIEEGIKKGIEKGKTEVPEGYIKLEECVPLEDIACKYTDEYDYTCLVIGDYGKQLDDPNNTSYDVVLSEIPDETEEYRNNIVNMSEVVDFEVTDTGLYLYLEDGNGYYWGE